MFHLLKSEGKFSLTIVKDVYNFGVNCEKMEQIHKKYALVFLGVFSMFGLKKNPFIFLHDDKY